MKRVISLLLCIALLLSLTSMVSASEVASAKKAIELVDRTDMALLLHQDTSAYDVYKVDIPATNQAKSTLTSNAQVNIKETLLSLCRALDYEQVGGYEVYNYTSATLGNYIRNCAEITNISEIGNFLYIEYTTTEKEEIVLCYGEQGLNHVVVYNPNQDVATMIQGDSITQYVHFREGIHFEMSEALLDEIDACLQEENYDMLLANKDLHVTTDENGAIWIEPSQAALQATSSVNDDARNLEQLKADFPTYTNEKKYSTTMYSSELGKRFSVSVNESRDSYTKKSANWKLFGAGTALSVIGLFIGGTVTTAAAVVTALGVGISTVDTILQQVTLSQSAIYKYSGERRGYVFDSITYQQNVRVICYAGTGEFHGVYDKNGNFVWGVFSTPSAYDHSYADVAQKSFDNYCADIVMNHYCSLYYPDSD